MRKARRDLLCLSEEEPAVLVLRLPHFLDCGDLCLFRTNDPHALDRAACSRKAKNVLLADENVTTTLEQAAQEAKAKRSRIEEEQPALQEQICEMWTPSSRPFMRGGTTSTGRTFYGGSPS